MRWAALFTLVLLAGVARAQIPLSSARLPVLPGAGLPGGGIGLADRLDGAVGGVGDDLDVRRLTDLRRRHVADLLRRYPRLIERDPDGDAIVRGEVLAFSPTDGVLDRARAAGFSIASEHMLGALGVRIVALRAPDGMTTRRALRELRRLDPAGTYDYDHLYAESGLEGGAGALNQQTGMVRQGGSGANSAGNGGPGDAAERVGLIDSGVDAAHPVFRDTPIHLHGCSGSAVPAAHGTEVASLLVGRATRFRGAAPGAELFAADVYCGLPTGGSVEAIVAAFDWLASQGVPVINVSLVGPPNALLARVVQSVIARGQIVVAAVGNDGPAAPPLYPAAYPGVVGVTAVDEHQRVLFEAERGPQVRFAAPGADMSAAVPPRGYAVVRGTSFAAPIVAGLLASELRHPDSHAAQRAIAELAHRALDLGARGVDPVYGYGLVGAGLGPEPTLARAQ